MPPVLDPSKSRVDGLAFLGLSLAREGPRGHPASVTHQTALDLDAVQDRDYEHIFSTNDDGWLVGGGEPGPPHSFKLPAQDSAHVEVMRIGTYEPTWGGVYADHIIATLQEGKILIPEITVVPTGVVANGDQPPELEIRFDMVPTLPNFDDPHAGLPVNWQLRFIQNQLFKLFQFPSRFNPGSFHSTILRKAEFRSPDAREAYFRKCQGVVDEWMDRGHQPLAPVEIDHTIEVIRCAPVGEAAGAANGMADYYRSGLWLFTDRKTITHHFLPNFLPPYDTPAKRRIILQVLKEEWDEKTLSWKSLVPETASKNALATTPFDLPAMIADLLCGGGLQQTVEGDAPNDVKEEKMDDDDKEEEKAPVEMAPEDEMKAEKVTVEKEEEKATVEKEKGVAGASEKEEEKSSKDESAVVVSTETDAEVLLA
jgi:hypothetical protein